MRGARWVPSALAAGAAVFGLLACRPVFVIGWEELAVITLLVAFLLGPLLFRLARAWMKFEEWKKQKKK